MTPTIERLLADMNARWLVSAAANKAYDAAKECAEIANNHYHAARDRYERAMVEQAQARGEEYPPQWKPAPKDTP